MKKLILMFLVVMVLPFISSSQPFTYDNLKIGNRLDVTVGGQIITAAKGDLITDDGTSTTALSVGSNGQVLITNSAESTGLEWRDLVMYDITDFATAHGNATTGIHGVGAGAIVSTSTTQTLTNKTISGSTNTIGANELRTTGASVVIDGSSPPLTNQILTATSSTSASWQTPNFHGTEFHQQASLPESTTTSTIYQLKTLLTTSSLPAGLYRIGYSFELSNAASGLQTEVEVNVDGNVVALPTMEGGNDYPLYGGFVYQSLSGLVTATIKYRVQTTGIAKIRRASLELWRIN